MRGLKIKMSASNIWCWQSRLLGRLFDIWAVQILVCPEHVDLGLQNWAAPELMRFRVPCSIELVSHDDKSCLQFCTLALKLPILTPNIRFLAQFWRFCADFGLNLAFYLHGGKSCLDRPTWAHGLCNWQSQDLIH